MVVVKSVIPVGVVGDQFGVDLLMVGELWFLLGVERFFGSCSVYTRVLFNGDNIARHIKYTGAVDFNSHLDDIMPHNYMVYVVAVKEYLVSIGGG